MAQITIGGIDYIIEQDDDGFWYYRTEYSQSFGKKVKLKEQKLMVWGPNTSHLEGDSSLPGGGEGGDGSPYPSSIQYWSLQSSVYDGTVDVTVLEPTTIGNDIDDMCISVDGLHAFILYYDSEEIWQFKLNTAFDITSLEFENSVMSIAPSNGTGIHVSQNGLELYLCDNFEYVKQYTMTSPWNLSTASYTGFYDVSADGVAELTGATISPDGTKLYCCSDEGTPSKVYQWTLGTAFDITSATLVQDMEIRLSEADWWTDIEVSTDGDYMFLYTNWDYKVQQYKLHTAWDISTATLDQIFDVPSANVASNMCFSSNGEKMYLMDYDGPIWEYTLSDSWTSDDFIFLVENDFYKTYTLPLVNGYNYNFTVDWGDGTVNSVNSYNDVNATHTYAANPDITKVIKISGVMEKIQFKNDPSCRSGTLFIQNLGDVGIIDFSFMFEDCLNIRSLSGSGKNVFTDATSVANMFDSAGSTLGCYIGCENWDVSTIEDFSYLFWYILTIQQPFQVQNWDMSSALDLEGMFGGAGNNYPGQGTRTDPDVSLWNVSNVTNMMGTFGYAECDPDVSNWDMTNVINIESMFEFNDYASPDVSLWDTLSVEQMEWFCSDAPLSNCDLTNWDTSSMTNCKGAFWGAPLMDIIVPASSWWGRAAAWTTYVDAFNGCTLIPNYAVIPVDWK